jgi:SAM-dependent methyltransferase
MDALLGRTKLAVEWLEPADTLLDVGCSDGILVSHASMKCRRAVGLDVDEEALQKAHQRWPEVELCYGSAVDLPFDDSTFSVVTMMDVLEHVPDPVSSLREVDRVLRPGGRLVLSVPHKGTFGSLDAQRSILFGVGRKILRGKGGQAMDHRHFLLDEVVSMVGPGFRVGKTHMGGYLIFPLCGYALMLTDNLNVATVSRAIRRLEERDFERDYGERSWHLMAEFVKTDRPISGAGPLDGPPRR